MNNQWGRNGSGPAAGRGGAGGILFASVVCLALGGAAGYAAFRFTGDSAPSGEVEQRDRRIADLAKELDARVQAIDESGRKADALLKENATLKQQVDALENAASTPQASVSEAEYARLTQETIPSLKNELELARQRIADAEALKARAEEAVRDRERRLSLGADQIARLEKALDAARSDENAAQTAETERLEAEADTLRRQLSEAQAAAEKVRTGDLPALRAEIARKDKEIAALKAQNGVLTTRVAALEAASRAAQPSRPVDGAEKPVRDTAKPSEGRNPRNASLVARAMQDTPGLDRLNDTQRDRLERTLVSGECVTNALGGVFKRVPVLALRNLMRDLDSDC